MAPGITAQRLIMAEQGKDFDVSLPHHLAVHHFLHRLRAGVRRFTFVQTADGGAKLRQVFHVFTEIGFVAGSSELSASWDESSGGWRGRSTPAPVPRREVPFVSVRKRVRRTKAGVWSRLRRIPGSGANPRR